MQSDISSCLIIHGFGGGVHEVKILAAVKLKSVNYIYNNISSKIKKVKFYKDGGHLILESQTNIKYV